MLKKEKGNKRQCRELRLYQVGALEYCQKVNHPALFMDMRLGKTIVTIRSIINEGYQRVLVVCPSEVIDVWREELNLEGI